MAEFSEIMKRWREICIDMVNVGMCKNRCPLRENNVCGYMDSATDEDIEEAEKAIMKYKRRSDLDGKI